MGLRNSVPSKEVQQNCVYDDALGVAARRPFRSSLASGLNQGNAVETTYTMSLLKAPPVRRRFVDWDPAGRRHRPEPCRLVWPAEIMPEQPRAPFGPDKAAINTRLPHRHGPSPIRWTDQSARRAVHRAALRHQALSVTVLARRRHSQSVSAP